MRRLPLLALPVLLLSCRAEPIGDDDAAIVGDDDDAVDDDDAAAPDWGTCEAVWGPAPASGRIHVHPAGSPAGDGSLANPYDDLQDAIDASRTGGQRSVALAAGTWTGSWTLDDGSDVGLTVVGCGSQLTRLQGTAGATTVDIAGVDDVVVEQLGTDGGRRGVRVRDDAGAGGPIGLRNLDVQGATHVGVVIEGEGSASEIVEIDIGSLTPGVGELGYGIVIQTGADPGTPLAAPTTIAGLDVSGAHGVGILADSAWVEIQDSTVSATQTSDDGPGRGVQLQNHTRGLVDEVTVVDSKDAGIFLHDPGRNGFDITVRDSEVRNTSAAPTEARGGGDPADGLVAMGSSGVAGQYPVTVDGFVGENNARVQVLAESVTIEVDALTFQGVAALFDFATQGGAVATGIGGGLPPVIPVDLDLIGALDIVRAPLAGDDGT